MIMEIHAGGNKHGVVKTRSVRRDVVPRNVLSLPQCLSVDDNPSDGLPY